MCLPGGEVRVSQDLLQLLIRLESEFHHAGQLPAPARLERLLHPDFHEVGRSGNAYDRQTVVDYLSSLRAAPAGRQSEHALARLTEDLRRRRDHLGRFA